jgi:hypothetical protein
MIIKANKVRAELKDTIPKLSQIWLMDTVYESLSLSDLKAIVKARSVKGFKFIPDVWDCDNFALQLHARVRRLQYDLIKAYPRPERRYPWLFCEGVGLHSTQGVHAVNIALTSDAGIQYIEPQTDRITSHFNGNIFFVKG